MPDDRRRLISQRYLLHEPLGKGSMGVVYRATDRLTQSPVALKQVTAELKQLEFALQASTASLSTELNLTLAHEFQVLAALHHPNIISVLDYGFDVDGPYFTMEYLAGSHTILDVGRTLPVLDRVQLLIQALQALAYLHRRQILHRDLKPANILMQKGQVKLLDFGLSVQQAHARGIAGTLAYMAPEVIEGHSPRECSDLYSLGVIAYELFAGKSPYGEAETQQLIRHVLATPPDLDALRFDDAPSAGSVTQIIGRLLHKSPEMRYQTAQEVIAALSQAVDQPALAQETIAIRESFLQAAPFVGRHTERDQLMVALGEALAGRGSAWLIGGESGVGKSRLLDELRSPALVKGVFVLHGQALESGGSPNYLWRAPLRRLALSTTLTDLEAGVLKSIVPDIAALVGRAIRQAPKLDNRAAQQRLAQTVADVFRRQTQPVLLLLDDLQWARESLLILRELARTVSSLPLLIVGNYRDDERPDIPGELPNAQVISLSRFSTEAIGELSAAMLGEAGRQPHIVEFLQRETEGNVFFMVETVRALAADVPNLGAVAQAPLPERMFPKGVQAIAQKRLERMPLDYHPLLRIAAVAGRQIDPRILRQIDRVVNLDLWLLACADAGIVVMQDGQWIFAHDKLRDGILHGLALDQPRKLNRLVAEAIEKVYPNDESTVFALLHHWRAAEDVVKEIHYARLAGQQLLAVSSYQDALAFLRRAITAAEQPGAISEGGEETQAELLDLKIQLADTLYSVGEYAEARQQCESVIPAARAGSAQASLATAARILGNIAQASGDFAEARRLFQDSLTVSFDIKDRLRMADAMRNLGLVAENLGEMGEAIHYYQQAQTLFQAVGDWLGVAGSLANLGSIAGTSGLYGEARQLYQEALSLFKAIGYRWGIAYTLIRLGEAAFLAGDQVGALASLEEALAICQEIGHRWGIAFSMIQLGNVNYALRRTRSAGQHFLRALQIAQETRLIPTMLEALVGVAMFLHADEQSERAAELLSLVLATAATDADTKRRAESFLATLDSRMDAGELAAYLGRGQALDLEKTVRDLLADCAGIA
ncbi:MAG: protein kinase [Chloroflexi bacterium]|nr:protein kinase [Chloroflexota bacterium]